MSTTPIELPCRWRHAGEAGEELLAAMAEHLPHDVAIHATWLGEDQKVLDADAAIWSLEDEGTQRAALTNHHGLEVTVWAQGQEVKRSAFIEARA